MNFADDLDIFFDPEITTAVTYTAHSASGVVVSGILDEPGSLQMFGTVPVQVTKRQLVVKTSDVPRPSTKDTITVGESVYDVASYKPDGTGITVLTLADNSR